MQKLTTFLVTLTFFTTSYGQKLETLGTGVIDFLLTKPKTANPNKVIQLTALNVIGNVCRISSKNKIDLDNTSQSEIVISTNSGNEAVVYSTKQGNVHLLYKDVIYPMTASLINLAKNEYENQKSSYVNTSIKNIPLYESNFSDLINKWRFYKTKTYTFKKTWQRYYLKNHNESIKFIAKKHDISRDDIYFKPYKLEYGHPNYGSKFTLNELLNTDNIISKGKRKKILKIYNSQKKLTKAKFGCSDFAYDGLRGGTAFRFVGYKKPKSADGFAIYIQVNKKIPEYSYKNATLSEYNLSDLRSKWKFSKTKAYTLKKTFQRYNLKDHNESVKYIAKKNGVSRDDIYFKPYKLKFGHVNFGSAFTIDKLLSNEYFTSEDKRKKLIKLYNSQAPLSKTKYGCSNFAYDDKKGGVVFNFVNYKKPKSADGFAIYIQKDRMATEYLYKTKIVTTFTCNSEKNLDQQRINSKVFQEIKRSFFKDENFLLMMGYTTERIFSYKLKINEASTGKTVFSKIGITEKDKQFISVKINNKKLPIGKYIYRFTLINPNKDNVSKSEKFEILKSPYYE
ncbi:hypothetical protein SAMN04487765_3527 [Tenacibaculum sp. MAR_2010_89]|uniref:hypothetical protein n=1 Tax=Tenacibaculum sp. MAR_2010_89 TaxID=1250198 RepID=UPI00089B4ECD|nr:hypothetical protein [Tenacibaculum sp. MAR_2010_89]SEE63978.1 hypothetical protein SAMN04487765_3527 [Tenacibaculum sp. MAR_2010_89]